MAAGAAALGEASAYGDPRALAGYLVGTWKQCFEERDFGGVFQHRRASNGVVDIHAAACDDPGVRLQWCTVVAPHRPPDRELLYSMTLTPATSSSTVAVSCRTHRSPLCDAPAVGHFVPGANSLTLTDAEPGAGAVTSATYRVVDEDTMAVVVTECTADGARVLMGSMYRIDLAQYPA
eukprot:TRINITY_DN32413_c0_g1_i1.p2 TRINITY_DN32413_c0_g1~~TRINITY_DN32413_c0_g1_i1.p2  ORF type:complete len:197 (+),score=50.62 TRINITY_DN32413_c0_g1_i1:59-592(+)